jgi:hypothetical protein
MSAPLVSWIAFGTAFSTFCGSPSCSHCGTLLSPVACETLPVSLLEFVSCAASGILCSTEEGTWVDVLASREDGRGCWEGNERRGTVWELGEGKVYLLLCLLRELRVFCVAHALALVVLHDEAVL